MLNHQLENRLQSWTLTVQYLYHYLLIIATEQKKNPPKNDSTQLTGDTRTHFQIQVL